MSKADGYETSLLNLVLAAKAYTNVASASTASTSIWVALHTADPGDTGNQTTNEASYGGYARIVTNRTTVDWNCTSGSASPLANITFPTSSTTSTQSITHFSVGLSSSGSGTLLYSGTVTPNIHVSNSNVTPQLSTATAITED